MQMIQNEQDVPNIMTFDHSNLFGIIQMKAFLALSAPTRIGKSAQFGIG